MSSPRRLRSGLISFRPLLKALSQSVAAAGIARVSTAPIFLAEVTCEPMFCPMLPDFRDWRIHPNIRRVVDPEELSTVHPYPCASCLGVGGVAVGVRHHRPRL